MLNRLFYLFISFALVLTSCSKDDEGGQQPAPVPVPTPDTLTVEGAKLQVMVVFAPGQLGDQGYADNVMDSIVQMQQQQKLGKADSINIDFIALYSFQDTRQRLRDWAAEPANPYYNHDYDRRLLVLTEPYMTRWIGDFDSLLRPTDEVLLLKATEADLQKVAATSALNQRLHALNIDMSPTLRWYATYITENLKQSKIIWDANHEEGENEEEEYDDWYDDWDDDWYDEREAPIPDHVKLYIYRQYDPTVVTYSDGMEEVLRQELGPDAEINMLYVENKLDDGNFNEGTKNSYLETVYQTAYQISEQGYEEGRSYFIFDLGVWNIGAVNFMENGFCSFSALMIDACVDYEVGADVIKNDYGHALQDWVNDWCQQPAATMPQNRTLGSDYITDDMVSSIGDVHRENVTQ